MFQVILPNAFQIVTYCNSAACENQCHVVAKGGGGGGTHPGSAGGQYKNHGQDIDDWVQVSWSRHRRLSNPDYLAVILQGIQQHMQRQWFSKCGLHTGHIVSISWEPFRIVNPLIWRHTESEICGIALSNLYFIKSSRPF